ncbi:hypothetical protein BKA70DRAFT_1439371 [Coprinopsis sp. MPI-PUGE-AT-0042]|nr:hypothetical protein BKA70DRAFT_1439371 [Coprinopsis sp. MPI-PUGE-AT-0042]
MTTDLDDAEGGMESQRAQLAKYHAITPRITAIEELLDVTLEMPSLLRREHPPVAAYTSHPEKQDAINTCVVDALGDTTKAHVRITLLVLHVVDSIDKRTKIAYYAYSTSKLNLHNPKADGSYPVHHRLLHSERDLREEHAVHGFHTLALPSKRLIVTVLA